ncbi:signal peptidase I [Kitasatospora viridis]|uniref:Signal peptidase I n=1 Tax=Kitasatospora viridis TaxID=281105 RepID=A0A561S9S3_9ACTN|nr:signal peptidase I [Kitasatospora viridis]TWF71623.1 signal peptidase I [Kitasatospora viridis]
MARGEGGRRVRRVLFVALGVSVGLCAALAVAVAALAVRVDGHSMQPTLANGQRLLTVPGTGGTARRFDVVLLRAPGRDTTIVKRVIGLPGDRVEIDSTPQDPFTVLVQPGGSGQWYRVDQSTWPGQAHRSSNCCQPDGRRDATAHAQAVPPGKLFFLGDNPDGSDDARSYGWGDLATVSGRIGLRVWPLGAFGPLPTGPTLSPVPAPSA